MILKFNIDEDCKHCKEALAYLKKLHKQNKNAYCCYNMLPISKLIKEKRDLGEQDRIMGVTLTPDYNSSGHLTHFHIKKEEKRK